MIAAMVMGKDVLPPPATFNVGVMTVAMMIHLVMSIVLGIILDWIIWHWRMGLAAALGVGAVFGL